MGRPSDEQLSVDFSCFGVSQRVSPEIVLSDVGLVCEVRKVFVAVVQGD
jgi:hypothetical protein